MNAHLRASFTKWEFDAEKKGQIRGSGMIESVEREEARLPNLLSRGDIC